MKLKRHTESLLSNGTPIKTLITKMQPLRYSRRLGRRTLYSQIPSNVPPTTNMAKRASTLVVAANDNNTSSRTLVDSVDLVALVSEDQECKAASRSPMQMRFLERHLEAEIHLKISLEMMTISSTVGDSLENHKVINLRSSHNRDKEASA